jgi:hypothetical protein
MAKLSARCWLDSAGGKFAGSLRRLTRSLGVLFFLLLILLLTRFMNRPKGILFSLLVVLGFLSPPILGQETPGITIQQTSPGFVIELKTLPVVTFLTNSSAIIPVQVDQPVGVFDSAVFSPLRTVRVNLSLREGLTYQLQSSTDLKTWTNLKNIFASQTTQSLSFDAAKASQYFRVKQLTNP